MRAVVFQRFAGPLRVQEVPEPSPSRDGVVIRVAATGLCRSDWHGWQGHDPDIRLPHVPGHELAGTVSAIGADVRRARIGDRVTVPFVCACGRCAACASGNQQVCEHQTQPGFTHWGSFAELVALEAADTNLVTLPDELDFGTAAALGCRYATAFRAVVHQGGARPGDRVVIQGCGGVGLSAVQIAVAAGASVVAVDVSRSALTLARELGAATTIDARGMSPGEVAGAVVDATDGGAHLALDALGSPATCAASVLGLRRRGRHVQVGLLPAVEGHPPVPMDRVIAYELELVGSHGMPAHHYPQLLALVADGTLRPDLLVTTEISLDEVGAALDAMSPEPDTARGPADAPGPSPAGITVVRP